MGPENLGHWGGLLQALALLTQVSGALLCYVVSRGLCWDSRDGAKNNEPNNNGVFTADEE